MGNIELYELGQISRTLCHARGISLLFLDSQWLTTTASFFCFTEESRVFRFGEQLDTDLNGITLEGHDVQEPLRWMASSVGPATYMLVEAVIDSPVLLNEDL